MSGRADYLELGDWNAVCYECGRKRKASALVKHWQGYYVCPEHWEPRHPQDFVRSVPDVITPPWTQPMPADSFGQARIASISDGGGTGGGQGGSGTTAGNSGVVATTSLVVSIPWSAAGSTITDFLLTDYVTVPAAGTAAYSQLANGTANVLITIPSGVVINGSFSFGTGWPSGTTFVVNNGGSMQVSPTFPSNTTVTVQGSPAITRTSPTYTVNWNGYGFGTINFLYMNAGTSPDALTAAIAAFPANAGIGTTVCTWIITVTGTVEGMTIQNFVPGCSFILINQGNIVGTAGQGGSGGISSTATTPPTPNDGTAGSPALTITRVHVSIDNGAGNIWGGAGGGGGGGSVYALSNAGYAAFAGGGGGSNGESVSFPSGFYQGPGMVRISNVYHAGYISQSPGSYSTAQGNTFTAAGTTETLQTLADELNWDGIPTTTTGSGVDPATAVGGTGGAPVAAGNAGNPGTAATGTGSFSVTIVAPGAGGAAGNAISLVSGATVTINGGNNATQIKGTVG